MKKLIRIRLLLLLIFVSCIFVIYFLPLPPLFLEKSQSVAFLDEQHKLLRLTLSEDEKYRINTTLAEISPSMIAATLLAEDQYFYKHIGINPISLLKAIRETYFVKTRRRGASTITMQVARMRYDIHSKNWQGKLFQILRALQLEMHYSKNEILTAYFNLAPYGNNIEGVSAASLIYFNKNAKNLSLDESMLLTIIPQNPNFRIPFKRKADEHPSAYNLQSIRNQLFSRWIKDHVEDKNKKYIFEMPLQIQSLHHLPFFAPHFTDQIKLNVLTSNRDKSASTIKGKAQQCELSTTLNLELQTILERTVKNYLIQKNKSGVYNAACLLVDVRTMEVKAMLGSANYFDKKIEGQINGTHIQRSPGSTLKPFIYALALDQGLIHPNTLLKDVPHSFGSYNPENFDYDFLGPIKAKDALVLSRNIPAIYLADQLNHPNLYNLLTQVGIKNLKAESHYGLSLALGGAPLSMQELVGLYAALANEGVWYPLRVTKNAPHTKGIRIFSPEASFLVLDMLRNNQHHDPDNQHLLVDNAKSANFQPAWKTGTSSGYKDAWTVGIIGPYVLAVWIGNFDNTSNHIFVGKEIAAPLFFEIFNAIKPKLDSHNYLLPNPTQLNLVKIPLCKASGLLPTAFCHDQELGWFIPGKSPIKSDNIFRKVAIDSSTGLRTCRINEKTEFKIFEFWPSDILKIFKLSGLQPKLPPAYDDSCKNLEKWQEGNGVAPQIISPQSGVEYIIKSNHDQQNSLSLSTNNNNLKNIIPLSDYNNTLHNVIPLSAYNNTLQNVIPLSATADADVSNLYWFIDNIYLGKKERDHVFLWTAKPGTYLLRVVDDHGRADEIKMVVRSTASK